MKTAFIGHETVFTRNICERLAVAVKNEIVCGCRTFTMGINGEFDKLALNVCKWIRINCKDLIIEVVITSSNILKKEKKFDCVPYIDVNTVMYDIKDAPHNKQFALMSKRMIDTCDTLICYVDTNANVGEVTEVLRYAEKQGLKIVNLYGEEDRMNH